MKSMKIEFHEHLRIVLEQLDRREKYSKSLGNLKFIVQEILNYILISKKSCENRMGILKDNNYSI